MIRRLQPHHWQAPFWGIILTAIFLWPTLTHFSTHLPSDQDGLFVIWTVNWISQALTAGLNFFEAPFFYPFHQTLAYSQPMFSQGLLNIPLTWFTTNLVIMSNVHLIAGSVLGFMAMYWLIFDQTKSKFAAGLASLIFSFGLWHAQYLVHLNTYAIAGIPAAVWAGRRYLTTQNYGHLLLAAIFCLYQMLNDPMYGFFLLVILSTIFFNKKSLQLIKVKISEISLTLLGVAIIVFAFYWPYWQVSEQFHYVRTIRDAAHFALSIDQLFNMQLAGLYGLILILGYLASRHLKKPELKKLILPSLIVLCLGLILALGPVAKWHNQTIKIFDWPIPLPYAVTYYLVPGMKAFRAASRWVVVANFGLSLLVGLLAAQSRLAKPQQAGLLLLTLGWLWWFNHTYVLIKIPTQIPDIYQTVKNRPEPTLAELPAYTWGQQPEVTAESYRLMYQNYHRKQLYNGASGFTPPSRMAEWPRITAQFPDTSAIGDLKHQGIELVIVHWAEYEHLFSQKSMLNSWPAPDPKVLKNQLAHSQQLTLISCQENDCLYKLK